MKFLAGFKRLNIISYLETAFVLFKTDSTFLYTEHHFFKYILEGLYVLVVNTPAFYVVYSLSM